MTLEDQKNYTIAGINDRKVGTFRALLKTECDPMDYDLIDGADKLVKCGKVNLYSKEELGALIEHAAELKTFGRVFVKLVETLRENGCFEENAKHREWLQKQIKKSFNQYRANHPSLLTEEGLKSLIATEKAPETEKLTPALCVREGNHGLLSKMFRRFGMN